MKKKVKTIAHIHVWDKMNKGDLAIVLAAQELLLAKFPEAHIIDYPVEVLKTYDQKKAAALNSADLVIMGGGGLFYRYFLPFSLEMISAIKKPFATFGLGYIREVGARPLAKKERDSVIALAKRANFLSVRENYTKRFLVKYGIPSKKIKVIGDPALLLQEPSTKIKLAPGFKLGLNLNYSGWLGFGQWREDILNSYRETAKYFQENYGASVYYLKHHPGEDNIYPELKIKGLKLLDEEPRLQKTLYGKLDLVIGMMLHSCVMAAGAITPEINVAYDLRNRNFARFLGIPESIVELDELKKGALLKRAKHFVKQSKDYQNKLTVFKAKVARRTQLFLDEIADEL
ncbi:MAG: polysaccharide pyruvyl transferase family protein [bacterium]|nr:polysaccharide pyruvyl transferase family protein [bacterium]